LFVAVSLGLLGASAWAVAYRLDGRLARAFAAFALFCSLPTYLMLWNAQMHVLLIAAVSLILGGLIGLARDEGGSPWPLRMVQAGVLVSLLSKPLVAAMVPALFATRETRRALLAPVAAYAAVSVFFLVTPALNPGGYNGIHWLYVLGGFSPEPLYSLVFPRPLDLSGSDEIYSLPAYLCRVTGAPVPPWLLRLPPLAVLAAGALPLFLTSRSRRIRVLLAAVMLAVLSQFLGYYMAWEYHYTTVLPLLPVLGWMAAGEERAPPRWLLRAAFVALLANFLPTPHWLAPGTPARFLEASTLLRVVPVVVAFACLLLYAGWTFLAAAGERPRGVELPRGQTSDLVRTGGALAALAGIVMASVLASVPARLKKPLQAWGNQDWAAHFENVLSRPTPGLEPASAAELHQILGRLYARSDRSAALRHYAAAVDRSPGDPDLLCEMGDLFLSGGRVEDAVSAYRRVLRLNPHHPTAVVRLRVLLKAEDLQRERAGRP
jgi:hypothetical protein